MSSDPTPYRNVAALWGVLGTLAVLVRAIARLSGLALEPFTRGDLTAVQWAALAGFVVFMVYTEGWRGFHLQFSPRVVVRSAHLGAAPWWVKLLAPAACMGLIWANRKRLIISRALIVGIVVLVLLVRALPYPWRNIVDAGVVVGLATGTASIVWYWLRALAGEPPTISPDLPDAAAAPV